MGGFVLLSIQRSENKITGSTVSDGQDGVYRILILGDSMIAGWPRQLEKILNNRSPEIQFEVFDEMDAVTNTAFILANLKDNLERYNPDMVITMTGLYDRDTYLKYTEKLTVDLLLENVRVYKLGKLILANWKKRLKDSEIIKFAKGEDIGEEFVINEEEYQQYMELGRMSWEIGEYAKAAEMYKKAIEINPENEQAYVELAEIHWNKGERAKAKEMFKKAIDVNPKNEQTHIIAGDFYNRIKEYVKSKEMFEKAIKINPENEVSYTKLSWVYQNIGEFIKAEEMGKKAIKINPENIGGYSKLARLYFSLGKHAEAEEMYKMVIKINPEVDEIYFIELIQLYFLTGEYTKAEKIVEKTGWPFKIEKNISDIRRYHYRKLYEILNQQGIKYVAMQYPILNVEELKLMFDGNEDIIFVSNEENFKKAIKNGKYEDYFIDNFAGDFGHCTEEGNRLIAENVANVILEELGIKK